MEDVGSRLEQLSTEELGFLVALPYRVGLWISESDDTGGDEADAAEWHALECIITGFAEDFCKTEAVEKIIRQTISGKDKWPEWSADLSGIPAECRKAIEFMAEHFDHKEVTSFKNNLMEIAMAVAMAFREVDEAESLQVKLKIKILMMVDKAQSLIHRRDLKTMDELLNVSNAEKLALDELEYALQIDKIEGLEPEDIYEEEFEVKKYKIPDDFMAPAGEER